MHQHRITHSHHTASATASPPPAEATSESGHTRTSRTGTNRTRKVGPLRRWLLVGLMLLSVGTDIGCFVPIYSSSRDERARQLIYVSENFRHIPAIWERIWGLDMPDTATAYRVHGGVI